jgi:outer membrane receptor protein involved in Fe transport
LIACALAAVPALGHAAPARMFRLPSEPLAASVVRFGIQGAVSVGGLPAAGCEGYSRPVIGLLRPQEALRRLLPPGCGFRRIDARSFRIVGGTASAPPSRFAPPLQPAMQIDEIVVTAEKRAEPLRGSPFAVTALQRDDLERLGAKSFADVVSQVPAVAETNLGPGRDKIFIRGISDGVFTGRTQSTVGLYLDDVPITYNAPDPDLRLADVARLEVLRGPQGTLYGSGSIGGIVRIISAKPDLDRFEGAVTAEGTRNDRKDRAAGVEGYLNAPVVRGKLGLRVVGYHDELAGYLDNPGLGLDDVNHGRRAGGRAEALAELGGDWTAQATLVRQSIRIADSQYVQGGGSLSRDAKIREPHHNDFTLAGLATTHDGDFARLSISAAYIDHDFSTRYDATGAFDLAPSQVAAFDETQGVELWVAEAMAESTQEGRLRWLAGGFLSHSREVDSALLDATLSGGPLRSVFRRRDSVDEAAVFGEVSYELRPRLTATIGGRVFTTMTRTRADGFDLAVQPLAPVDGRLRNSGFAPKVRLSYALAPDRVVYVSAQDGFRAGGFNVPAAADGQAGGPDVRRYEPDRLRSYEIGGEATFWRGSLTIRAALFHASWSNVQTDQFRPSGLPVTINVGDGSNTGLELEADWRPDAHLRVRANGLLNQPELTRSQDIFPAKADTGLPGVAKATGGLDVAYRWPVSSGLDAELSGQASYIGHSSITFDGASISRMGDYAEGRVAGRLLAENWSAEAFVENVTDERGDTFAFGNPFSRMRSKQSTPLRPREFGLRLRRGF